MKVHLQGILPLLVLFNILKGDLVLDLLGKCYNFIAVAALVMAV